MVLLPIAIAGCGSPETQLEAAQKKIEGLTATTHAVGDAWLNGDVSSTYSGTAFQQALQLLDQQRTSLNTSATLLLDPRGASLSREAEQLSRTLAALIEDTRNHDRVSARQHLAQVPAAGDSP